MPMPRRRRRSGPRRPPTLAVTVLPVTSAAATLIDQAGAPHPWRTSLNQPRPIRSNAFFLARARDHRAVAKR
eukprot:3033240-Lingulodinium_polyedra.AAC.1